MHTHTRTASGKKLEISDTNPNMAIRHKTNEDRLRECRHGEQQRQTKNSCLRPKEKEEEEKSIRSHSKRNNKFLLGKIP